MINATHSRHIRWLILTILWAQRRQRQSQSGGWVDLSVLRKLLRDQGYPLSENDLHDYLVYLQDGEIAAAELRKQGNNAPYGYSARITSKGVRCLEDDEKIPGVGLYSGKDDE